MDVLESYNLPLSYLYEASYGGGRMAVPVLKSEALYANFAHVAGFAAESGSAAYSIDKLHILDVLIGELESARSRPIQSPEDKPSNPGRIDALIQQYGAEVHAIVNAPPMPYTPAATLPAGALFSMAA